MPTLDLLWSETLLHEHAKSADVAEAFGTRRSAGRTCVDLTLTVARARPVEFDIVHGMGRGVLATWRRAAAALLRKHPRARLWGT
jgi:hypothetical protein